MIHFIINLIIFTEYTYFLLIWLNFKLFNTKCENCDFGIDGGSSLLIFENIQLLFTCIQ